MSDCIICGKNCSPVKLAMFGVVNGKGTVVGYASIDCIKRYENGECDSEEMDKIRARMESE